jgi:hypothetical protein
MNDAEWTIEFNTLSRDGAIKICTILANAIDEERLTSKNTRIFVLGGKGKSLIMDAMAQHLSDRHSAYKMSPKRFVEGKASAALKGKVGNHIVRGITHKGRGMAVSFRHLSGYHKKSWFENLRAKFDKSRLVGLDFQSEIDRGYEAGFNPNISIKFYPDDTGEIEQGWGRRWTITIKDKSLRTPQMREALDQIKAYDKRRKHRFLNTPRTSLKLP